MDTKAHYQSIDTRIDATRTAIRNEDYSLAERELLSGWREVGYAYRNDRRNESVRQQLIGYNRTLMELQGEIAKKGFTETYESAKASATRGLEDLLDSDGVDKLQDAAHDMVTGARKAYDRAKDNVADIADDVAKGARTAYDAAKEGISDATRAVKSKVQDVGRDIGRRV